MKPLFLLILIFSSFIVHGQVVLCDQMTIAYDDIYPMPPFHNDFEGGGMHMGSISARAFFLSRQYQEISTIDTIFVTHRFSDHYLIPGLQVGVTQKFNVFHDYQDFIEPDSTYSLPTSHFWRRRNMNSDFSFIDCLMTLRIKDLGLHDARLINRFARRRRDMFVKKQVRVFLVEEIMAMQYTPRSTTSGK